MTMVLIGKQLFLLKAFHEGLLCCQKANSALTYQNQTFMAAVNYTFLSLPPIKAIEGR